MKTPPATEVADGVLHARLRRDKALMMRAIESRSRDQHCIFAFFCMGTKIDVLAKPIERIREACDLVGYDFEQKLPDLETFLEGLVADGEDDEVTVAGLTFLSRSSSAE